MSRFLQSITLSSAFLIALSSGCQLKLNGKTVGTNGNDGKGASGSGGSSGAAGSNGPGDSSDDGWKTTSAGKQGLKHRPKGHPDGKPWVELWVDSASKTNDAHPLDFTCNKNKETDRCNGLDDDCDGKIDEDCGGKTGPLQVALGWDGHADLDLQVVYSQWGGGGASRMTATYASEDKSEAFLGGGRDGVTLKLQGNSKGTCSCNPRYINSKLESCGSGCTMKRGACWADDFNEYVENAYIEGDELPTGVYEISFYNRGDCPRRLKQVRGTLGIVANGELVGHYLSGDLGPQGFSFPILTLYVPPR